MKKSARRLLFWVILITSMALAAMAGFVVMTSHPYQPQQFHVAVEQPPPPPPPPVYEEREPSQTAENVAPATLKPEEIKPVTGKPKIAIVIDDLGLDISGTARATDLPAYVTLSFMPYAHHLKEQTEQAMDKGHELLLHMPMEPIGHDDPGPGALLTGLPMEELRVRFDKALDSFSGFDGVNNHMGSKFTAYRAGMEMVMGELQPRHLFFLDSRTSAKSVGETIAHENRLPTISRDIFLDDDMAKAAVKAQLLQTERVAQRKGYAVAIGHPHVTTLEALETWLPEAEARGFVFVPVKSLIQNP